MSSTAIDTITRSKSAPVQSTNARPTLSLRNQDSNMATNSEPFGAIAPLPKSVDEISTYFIWSLFNLLFVPLGILCCFFSRKVNEYKLQIRYEPAMKWSRRTFILNIITTLVMIGSIIAVIMLRNDFVQRNTLDNTNQTTTTIAYIPWQPGR
jgi:hypothetical protein